MQRFKGKFMTAYKLTDIVALLTSPSGSSYSYIVTMIHGTWDQFKAAVAGKAVDVYNSLLDIPMTNALYLPDVRSLYVSGYDERTVRHVGTAEGDVIRNITGLAEVNGGPQTMNLDWGRGTGVFSITDRPSSASVAVASTTITTRNQGGLAFDTSRAVPTDTANHPQNINFLWCIKAYDSVTDPVLKECLCIN